MKMWSHQLETLITHVQCDVNFFNCIQKYWFESEICDLKYLELYEYYNCFDNCRKNPTSYGRPTADTSQDISEIQGSRTGRRTTLSFKRPRAPNDAADFSFSETNCGYLFFPKGGSFDASSMSISKHDQTPIVSSNMICFPCQGMQLLL